VSREPHLPSQGLRSHIPATVAEEARAAGSLAEASLSPKSRKLRPVSATDPGLSIPIGPPLKRSRACKARLDSSGPRESVESDQSLRARARAPTHRKIRVSGVTNILWD